MCSSPFLLISLRLPSTRKLSPAQKFSKKYSHGIVFYVQFFPVRIKPFHFTPNAEMLLACFRFYWHLKGLRIFFFLSTSHLHTIHGPCMQIMWQKFVLFTLFNIKIMFDGRHRVMHKKRNLIQGTLEEPQSVWTRKSFAFFGKLF